MFVTHFALDLEDPGPWNGAPSVPGWVGSTVNQHCQLRLEASLWGVGEKWSGVIRCFPEDGLPLGCHLLLFASTTVYGVGAPYYRLLLVEYTVVKRGRVTVPPPKVSVAWTTSPMFVLSPPCLP